MNDDRQNNFADTQHYQGHALSSFHQKRVLLPIAILGLLGTGLTWLMPSLRIISFLPPFLAVYALGHLLYPQLEKGREIEAGIMSGYLYQEKSAKRWHIIIVAAAIAALNHFFVSFYWEA